MTYKEEWLCLFPNMNYFISKKSVRSCIEGEYPMLYGLHWFITIIHYFQHRHSIVLIIIISSLVTFSDYSRLPPTSLFSPRLSLSSANLFSVCRSLCLPSKSCLACDETFDQFLHLFAYKVMAVLRLLLKQSSWSLIQYLFLLHPVKDI